MLFFFFFQAEDGIRDLIVTGVQTCALPICPIGTTAFGTASVGRFGPMGGSEVGPDGEDQPAAGEDDLAAGEPGPYTAPEPPPIAVREPAPYAASPPGQAASERAGQDGSASGLTGAEAFPARLAGTPRPPDSPDLSGAPGAGSQPAGFGRPAWIPPGRTGHGRSTPGRAGRAGRSRQTVPDALGGSSAGFARLRPAPRPAQPGPGPRPVPAGSSQQATPPRSSQRPAPSGSGQRPAAPPLRRFAPPRPGPGSAPQRSGPGHVPRPSRPADRPRKRILRSRSARIRIGSLVCAAVVVIIAGVTGVGQSDPSVAASVKDFLLAWESGNYAAAAALTTGQPATVT